MWHDHLFSQINKASKIIVEVKAGDSGMETAGKRDQIKLKKCGVGNIGGLHNIGAVWNPLPTMTHKELFWKKGCSDSLGKIFEKTCEEVHFY